MSVIIKGKNPNKPHTVRYWVDGKQREKSFATAGEAKDFRIKTDHDTRAKIFVDDKLGRENFRTACETWIDRKALSEGSKTAFRSMLSAHVGPALGARTIGQVSADRDAVADLLTKRMGHLSYSRRKLARQMIVDVLDEAVVAGKLQAHRCAGIELENHGNGKDHSDFVFPSHAQLTVLAVALAPLGLTIWLMRGCGLRIQEALAVQRSCFRDDGRTLRIFEQARPNGLGTMPLKHRKRGEYRDIPVPGYLWAMVKSLPDGYLFSQDGERFPLYATYLRAFTREAKKAGIPAGFTPHSLRHAFVSALLARMVPITDVARWVGHRDINTTYAVYGHLVPNAADRAVSVLDAEYQEWSAQAA